ncbi:LPD29 domain-containing protein [Chitinophaga sp. CF418]|uniref:LPD29 domain-containing protein n=1 Tax=Chitinophaga sp. CF418 TaxID=1855287 RepID=UPI0009176DED|nr:LPD29 domain-containing protein [Chitinophaga sp. CF418]SHN42198.1 hypothetical protein SAMN05216311_114126 [Chitinophaga sp. CF418]
MAKIKNQAARAAKEVKQILKAKYPNVTFSVKSEVYSGGDNINIFWQFGPAVREVEETTRRRQQGHFDGMNDIYVQNEPALEVGENGEINEVAGVKFVFEERDCKYYSYKATGKYYELRDDVMLIYKQIGEIKGWEFNASKNDYTLDGTWDNENCASTIYYRTVNECTFVSDNVQLMEIKYIGRGDNWHEPFTIIYKDLNTGLIYNGKTGEVETQVPAIKIENTSKESIQVKISMIDYSEKSIAIYGQTKEIKEQLSNLNGRFNKYLTHPLTGEKFQGWVFSAKRRPEILKALNSYLE